MSRIPNLFRSFTSDSNEPQQDQRDSQTQNRGQSNMSGAEARKSVSDVSHSNLDDWVRSQNFTNELEESIRGHIHQQLTTWMFYRKLAMDCCRVNIGLHGFSMLWQRRAEQSLIDMNWLEKYLILRGGRSKPTAIEAPPIEWPDNPVEPVHPCREALCVEKRILEDLERLSSLALKNCDIGLVNTIQTRFLSKQVKHVKNWGDLMRQVVRVSKVPGVGLYDLDSQLRHCKGHVPWGQYNDPDLHHNTVDRLTNELRHGLDLTEGGD